MAFSEQLNLLLENFKDQKQISLQEIETALAERGAVAVALALATPMGLPVALPGTPILFGFAIILLTIDIVLKRPPRLPKFLLQKKIENQTLVRIVQASCKALVFLERFLKPRFPVFFSGLGRWVTGFLIAICAFALAIPIPPIVPFTNTIPGFAIIFLCLGLLEDDGLFIIIGTIIAICAGIYFYTVWEIILKGFQLVLEKFS